ncbi:MAG: ribbon-helix-helix protein, CopG family [Opitutales bacterium]|nr:ribbon-helix-helix protein, CopG family [Opitutales bacterium]MCH8540643.1 ribbon-helix-helix domain-containing protein [Opitutales bacterium]
MKSHISATLDERLLADLNRFAKEERRSRSQVIELALENYLRDRTANKNEIVTSGGRFSGQFNRAETYAR